MAGVNPLKSYIENLKKSVVFIGYQQGINDEVQVQGTGFLVDVKGGPFLVTAKHVVYDVEEGFDKGLGCFYGIKSRTTEKYRFISFRYIKNKFKTDWIFHPENDDEDNDIDIAVFFFPQGIIFDEGSRKELGETREKYEIDSSRISPDYLLNLESVVELAEVFYIANQPGITSHVDITPIIRHGTVSKINEDDSTFLIDGFAYPGNSGSPVFQLPMPFKYIEHDDNLGFKGLDEGLIGVMGESVYTPYSEPATSQQTGETQVIFQANTGLSKVWSTNLLKEIFNSKKFKNTLSAIKKFEAV